MCYSSYCYVVVTAVNTKSATEYSAAMVHIESLARFAKPMHNFALSFINWTFEATAK